MINRLILDNKDKLENDPHDTFADYAIYDFLYSKDNIQLEASTKFIDDLVSLKKEAGEYWAGIVKKYFISAHTVMVSYKQTIVTQK